jgi:hypothetical protein
MSPNTPAEVTNNVEDVAYVPKTTPSKAKGPSPSALAKLLLKT